MSKRKTPDAKLGSPGPSRKPLERQGPRNPQSSSSSWFSSAAIRETVESVIVAFVLAFLFRTFEAEAFVIPTGSMAPTLMGRHKDLSCPKCSYEYQVGASSHAGPDGKEREEPVGTTICPMCRFPLDLPARQSGQYRTFSGDRILVGKFIYQFQEPRRWDVMVFKYPGDPTTNYIKRMVGLPGEKVTIHYGDLWIQRGDGPVEIARKTDPRKMLAMLQPVFDNDHMPKIAAFGLPARWTAEPGQAGQWTSPDGASFQMDANGSGEIRYHHRVPSADQWRQITDEIQDNRQPGPVRVGEQLISDFYAYNSALPDMRKPPPNWVGDLALEATVQTRSDTGEMTLDLVKGGRHFQCRVDLASGKATLGISGPDAQGFHPTASTPLKGTGTHKIVFANVDDQLRLLVDGNEVQFDGDTTYDSAKLKTHMPDLADLAPAGIASRGASLEVSHLKLSRDVYYIAGTVGPGLDEYGRRPPSMSDPESWPLGFGDMNAFSFSLESRPGEPKKDQFFMLGDNSPQSKDGRLWDEKSPREDRTYWVSRDMLIGQALFIYWPHSWDRIGPVPFPFFPNFGRMHLVR